MRHTRLGRLERVRHLATFGHCPLAHSDTHAHTTEQNRCGHCARLCVCVFSETRWCVLPLVAEHRTMITHYYAKTHTQGKVNTLDAPVASVCMYVK